LTWPPNTAAEHVAPAVFFGEQYRVLQPGGVCLMQSARRGFRQTAPCIKAQSAFEQEVWDRAAWALIP
jgi:hypothetical protein